MRHTPHVLMRILPRKWCSDVNGNPLNIHQSDCMTSCTFMSKQNSTENQSAGRNTREVSDPITHLPLTIHDNTSVELEQSLLQPRSQRSQTKTPKYQIPMRNIRRWTTLSTRPCTRAGGTILVTWKSGGVLDSP
ncbi:hypothetical protein BD779DRAFT_282190 [Infundibulicybe gibba]|nr:hypothetical protein BD779DRAFT_282190 [Infundibulicybe gibba]